jgi:Cu/Ag efflux protein CusF
MKRHSRLALNIAMFLCLVLLSPGLALAQGHAHGDGGASGGEGRVYSAEGEVVEVDAANNRLVISHGPIPQVGWEAMTMGFQVADASLLDGLAAGDKVRADIWFSGQDYAIVDLEKQ